MGVSYFVDGWYFFHDSIDPRQSSTTIKDGWIYSHRRYYQYRFDPSVVVSKELFVEPNTVYTLSVLADNYDWGPTSRPMLVWQTGEQLVSGGAGETDYFTVSSTSPILDIWDTPWVEDDPNYQVRWNWSPQTYSLYGLEGWNGIDGSPHFYDYENFRPKKWSVTFTTPSTLAYDRVFIVVVENRTSSVSRALYTQFQFERGNLITDWTTHQSEISAGSIQITTNGIDMYGGAEMNVYDGGLIHLDDGGKITSEKIWESYNMAARTELASGALDFYYKFPTTYGDDNFHLRGRIHTLAMKGLSEGGDPLHYFDAPSSQGLMFEAEKEGFIFTMKNNAGNEVAAYQTVNITSADQQRNVFYGGVKVASGALNVDGDIYSSGYKIQTPPQRYIANVPNINSTYKTIAYVSGGGLNAKVNLSIGGTTGSVVVAVVSDIIVNHSGDIYVQAHSGNYTELNIKILSNGDSNFYIQVKTTSANLGTMECIIIPYGNESVTMYTNNPTPAGSTTLEHVCKLGGFSISATGGIAPMFYAGGTKVSLEGHGHNYLPLSGGAITGSLTLPGSVILEKDPSYNSLRIRNPNGAIQIGPLNSGTCHLYTDRPSFYFNKGLIVNGVGVSMDGHGHAYVPTTDVRVGSGTTHSTAGTDLQVNFSSAMRTTPRVITQGMQLGTSWTLRVGSVTSSKFVIDSAGGSVPFNYIAIC